MSDASGTSGRVIRADMSSRHRLSLELQTGVNLTIRLAEAATELNRLGIKSFGQRGRLFSCVEALPPDQAALASRTSASGCALR